MENLKNDRSYECTLAKLATATNSHTQYHICIYTHHICIHTRRLQHLLIRNPIKHRNPTKQTIRQLRQSRRRIALSSPSSIQLGPLRPQNLLTHPPSVSFDYSTPTPTQTRERERERERETYTKRQKSTQSQHNAYNQLRVQIAVLRRLVRLSVLVLPTRRDSQRRCRSGLCKRHGLECHNSFSVLPMSLNSYRFIGTSDDLCGELG